jgi:hypothetical protein
VGWSGNHCIFRLRFNEPFCSNLCLVTGNDAAAAGASLISLVTLGEKDEC